MVAFATFAVLSVPRQLLVAVVKNVCTAPWIVFPVPMGGGGGVGNGPGRT